MSKEFSENITWLNIERSDVKNTVMVNVTEDCNLNCVYCYEHNKQGREFEKDKVVSKLDEVLARLKSEKIISVEFSGGEPLLAFDHIKEIFEYIVKMYIIDKKWKSDFIFSVTTNGTVLTPEMKVWFEQHPCFSFGLSLDGTPMSHNRNRSNSYAQVERNFDFFRKYKNPVKMTISPDSLHDCAAGIKHIHSLGFEVLSNVVFEDVWGDTEEKKEHLRIFSHQLSELIDFYDENPDLSRTNLVRPMIEFIKEGDNKPFRHYCGAGTRMALIDVDGKEFPCHRFAPMSNSRKLRRLNFNENSVKPDKCGECPLLTMCPSCMGYNFEYHGDINHRTTFHCDFFKLQARSAAILIFKEVDKIKKNQGIDNLSREEKDLLQQKLTAALFIEKFTRPLYEWLFPS